MSHIPVFGKLVLHIPVLTFIAFGVRRTDLTAAAAAAAAVLHTSDDLRLRLTAQNSAPQTNALLSVSYRIFMCFAISLVPSGSKSRWNVLAK